MALTLQQMCVLFDPMRQRLVTSFLQGSESVILPLLNWVDANEMLGYTFATIDDLGNVDERSLNGQYTPSDAKGSPKRETLSLFGGSIQTDNVLIDAKGDAARLLRIDKRMIALGKYFDSVFINGDSQANPKQFNGLRKRAELKANTLWTGVNGGALTQDLLDEALDLVGGDNSKKVILCDRWTRRATSKLVRTATGVKGLQEQQTQLPEYNGAKILTMTENHKRLPIFSNTETRGTANDTRSLYVVRFGGAQDEEYIQGIKGPSFMKLRTPVNLGEYTKDVVDNILGIGDFGDYSFVRIGGIK